MSKSLTRPRRTTLAASLGGGSTPERFPKRLVFRRKRGFYSIANAMAVAALVMGAAELVMAAAAMVMGAVALTSAVAPLAMAATPIAMSLATLVMALAAVAMGIDGLVTPVAALVRAASCRWVRDGSEGTARPSDHTGAGWNGRGAPPLPARASRAARRHDISRAVAVDIPAPDRNSSRHNVGRIAPRPAAPREPPSGASFRAAAAPPVKDPRRRHSPPNRRNSLPPPRLPRYPAPQRRLAILRVRSG